MNNHELTPSSEHSQEKTPELNFPRSFLRKIGQKIFSRTQTPATNKIETSPKSQNIVSKDNPPENPISIEKAHDPITPEEKELTTEMEHHRRLQQDFYRGERAQELSERALNQNLTPLSELSEAINLNEDGISKSYISYQDKKLLVFNLSGYPFRFLQHTVDYKLVPGNNEQTIGFNMAKRLVNDPSLWLKPASETQSEDKKQNANTLSCSYVDTDINLHFGGVRSELGISYGFSHVPPQSIIEIHNRDGATNNQAGNKRPTPTNFNLTPSELAKTSTHNYNEILMRRYNENNKPLPPDFLIVHNGQISEYTKLHAAYFNVPIINIEDEPYIEKQKQEIISQIDSLNASSNYNDIFNVFLNIDQSSLNINFPLKTDIYESYGGIADQVYEDRFISLPTKSRTKLQSLVEEIEPPKRLQMLASELSRVAAELKKAREENTYYKNNPFFISRRTRYNRNSLNLYYNPKNFVDSILINYNYPIQNGKVYTIQTILDSTDPDYEKFSQLIDQYSSNGGVVMDDRIKQE